MILSFTKLQFDQKDYVKKVYNVFISIHYIFRFIQDGSTFVHMLSLGSLQFCGFVKNAKLPKLSESVKSTTPDVDVDHPLSLAAGK